MTDSKSAILGHKHLRFVPYEVSTFGPGLALEALKVASRIKESVISIDSVFFFLFNYVGMK